MHKVFVYGTLRKGYGNNRLLTQATFLSKGETVNKYTMFASGIPYVNKHIETDTIKGELYEVTDKELERLDLLEGYNPSKHEDSWYKREKVDIKDENGSIEEAYIYFNDTKTNTIVESGDYTNYR
jgi:gamma-glutamylcyclotransferase (GGCT)/AIG2-like uncharacterized protein YtfP